jgi:two-component system, OmpR family, response regulator MprA
MDSLRIFLVEDEPRLARNYQRDLEEESYLVEVAHDGETALEILRAAPERFDIIILDILLPRRNGLVVCHEARLMGIAAPILLLTALDDTATTVQGLDAGADDYLTKPFKLDELLARLRALARRAQRIPPAMRDGEVRVADLVIDVKRYQVTRRGRRIALTPLEFRLIEILARHPDQVLHRARLQAMLWPDGTEAGSNVLDTYIHYLRDKVDRDEEVRLIHTVRGVGFVLRTTGKGSVE